MERLLERIGAARARVQQLHAERAHAAAALEAMEARAREGSRESDVLKARIKELEQENEVLRTAKAAAVGPDREGTKEKIDELVNEIDRCLALLNP
ncbi:MAG: hypothetical protein K8H89_06645 [Flavobacteriales bacterium]|jgi:uncharacterized protein YicC (UPF0701 family)|nr:hypothetical protein [Flavobacteriales bacterium]MCB0758617.1 hypothetical protein [Flavobacteriales bacterium]